MNPIIEELMWEAKQDKSHSNMYWSLSPQQIERLAILVLEEACRFGLMNGGLCDPVDNEALFEHFGIKHDGILPERG